MDYGKAFTYPQQDADWIKKFAILGGVFLVCLVLSPLVFPLLGLLLVGGYSIEITRRVITEQSPTLPEFTDLGGLFKNGVFMAVVAFVYSLPNIILTSCAQLPTILNTVAAAVDPDTAQMLLDAAGPLSFLSLCCSCLAFLYSVAIGMVLPAAFGRLAATGEIGSAFQFNQVIGLVRAQPAVYFIVFLISAVTSVFAAIVGIIACIIGVGFTSAYAVFITAHLNGQAYRVASGVTSASAGIAPA